MTKKIFKSIGFLALAIAVAIGSFFVNIQKDNKNNSTSASALDNVITYYTFDGADLFYLCVTRRDSLNYVSSAMCEFSTSITSYSDGVISISPNLTFLATDSGLNLRFNQVVYYDLSTNAYYGGNGDSILFTDSVSLKCLPDVVGATAYTPLFVSVHNVYSQFIADIYKIRIYQTNDIFGPNNDFTSICLEYYDVNDNFIRFEFYQHVSALQLEDRTYFLNNLDLSDNQIYNQGYNKGLSENQSHFYDDGYNTGYDDGFENGKISGAINANDYSFFSLFGAIFDAPVTLFTSLLNFEFLGINLWSFITSLLTLAIILFVVKLFIRR